MISKLKFEETQDKIKRCRPVNSSQLVVQLYTKRPKRGQSCNENGQWRWEMKRQSGVLATGMNNFANDMSWPGGGWKGGRQSEWKFLLRHLVLGNRNSSLDNNLKLIFFKWFIYSSSNFNKNFPRVQDSFSVNFLHVFVTKISLTSQYLHIKTFKHERQRYCAESYTL